MQCPSLTNYSFSQLFWCLVSKSTWTNKSCSTGLAELSKAVLKWLLFINNSKVSTNHVCTKIPSPGQAENATALRLEIYA